MPHSEQMCASVGAGFRWGLGSFPLRMSLAQVWHTASPVTLLKSASQAFLWQWMQTMSLGSTGVMRPNFDVSVIFLSLCFFFD